ncbi:MAG TPA: hypothetical protein VMB80_07055 [Candidatus Acidoferrum sp.]|nr:hypothetical protein [Candidatus Acidoferrum sp.]
MPVGFAVRKRGAPVGAGIDAADPFEVSKTNGAGAAADKLWEIAPFAAAVPSAPQTGHATGEGIAPPTGSTSKE